MSDQCKFCTSRGDFDLCQKTECNQHTSWMVNSLHSQLANSIPKEYIKTLLVDFENNRSLSSFMETLKNTVSEVVSMENASQISVERVKRFIKNQKCMLKADIDDVSKLGFKHCAKVLQALIDLSNQPTNQGDNHVAD